MASGCIFGDCPVCGELVWEDELDMYDDLIMHEKCKSDYIKKQYGMNESQFLRLMGAHKLREDIEFMKETEKERHQNYMELLNNLEKRLEEIEKIKRKDG